MAMVRNGTDSKVVRPRPVAQPTDLLSVAVWAVGTSSAWQWERPWRSVTFTWQRLYPKAALFLKGWGVEWRS